MIHKVYISYRRADSRPEATAIFTLLSNCGFLNPVMDLDLSIPSEVDARKVIAEEIRSSDLVIVVIGPDWLKIRDERGNYRIRNPNDLVRVEVETCIVVDHRRVILVLVNGAEAPNPEELPPILASLPDRKSVVVTPKEISADEQSGPYGDILSLCEGICLGQVDIEATSA